MASTEQHLEEDPAVAATTAITAAITNDREPVKVVPYFARSFGLTILCICLLVAGACEF